MNGTVTFSGASLLANVWAGGMMSFGSSADLYEVLSITSDAILTVAGVPPAQSGGTYIFFQTHDVNKAYWPMQSEQYGEYVIYNVAKTRSLSFTEQQALSGPFVIHAPDISDAQAVPTPKTIGTSVPVSIDLRAISFSTDYAQACGLAGTIIRAAKDGSAQVLKVPTTNVDLFGSYSTGSTVLHCGGGGLVARSTDEGSTWNMVDTGAGVTLRGMALSGTPSNNGFIYTPGVGQVIFNIMTPLLGGGTMVWLNTPPESFTQGLFTTDYTVTDHTTYFTITFATPPQAGGYQIYWEIGGGGVVVGGGGAILKTTDDGATWTAATSGVSTDLNAAIWAATQYVVVGDAGVVLTSPDGMVWTPQTTGVTDDLYSVAWDGTNLCAVGAGGVVLTSSDNGVTWVAQTSGTTLNLNAVLWDGVSRFVAGGALGTVLDTVDSGATWVEVPTGNTQTFYGGAVDGPRLSPSSATNPGIAGRTSDTHLARGVDLLWLCGSRDRLQSDYLGLGCGHEQRDLQVYGSPHLDPDDPDPGSDQLSSVAFDGTRFVALQWTTAGVTSTRSPPRTPLRGRRRPLQCDSSVWANVLVSGDGGGKSARRRRRRPHLEECQRNRMDGRSPARPMEPEWSGLGFRARGLGSRWRRWDRLDVQRNDRDDRQGRWQAIGGDRHVHGAERLPGVHHRRNSRTYSIPNAIGGGAGQYGWLSAAGMAQQLIQQINADSASGITATLGTDAGWYGPTVVNLKSNAPTVSAWTITVTDSSGFTVCAVAAGMSGGVATVTPDTTEDFTSIAWDGTTLLAFGEVGGFRYSTNATSWTLHSGDGGPNRMAVWCDLLWFASPPSSYGQCSSSPDITTWTGVANGNTNAAASVIFDGYKGVLAERSGGALYTFSPYGWASTPPITSMSVVLTGRIFTGPYGTHIAPASSGAIFVSSDLVNWTGYKLPTWYNLRAAATSGSAAMVVGNAGTTLYAAGSGWQTSFAITNPTNYDEDQYAAAYGAGIWITSGNNGANSWSNDNGANWNGAPISDAPNIKDAIFDGTNFLICGDAGTGGSPVIASSPDGATWTAASLTLDPADTLYALASGSGLWIAAGTNGDIVVSTDGLTWAAPTSVPTTALTFYSAGRGVARWIVAGASGLAWSSTDGQTWTEFDSHTTTSIYSVATVGTSEVLGTSTGATLTLSSPLALPTVTFAQLDPRFRAAGFCSVDGYVLLFGVSEYAPPGDPSGTFDQASSAGTAVVTPTKPIRGAFGPATSNGSTTISYAQPWGFTPVAGDFVKIVDSSTGTVLIDNAYLASFVQDTSITVTGFSSTGCGTPIIFGTGDSTSTVFSLPVAAATATVFLNGVKTTAFTVTGTYQVTFTSAPGTGVVISAADPLYVSVVLFTPWQTLSPTNFLLGTKQTEVPFMPVVDRLYP